MTDLTIGNGSAGTGGERPGADVVWWAPCRAQGTRDGSVWMPGGAPAVTWTWVILFSSGRRSRPRARGRLALDGGNRPIGALRLEVVGYREIIMAPERRQARCVRIRRTSSLRHLIFMAGPPVDEPAAPRCRPFNAARTIDHRPLHCHAPCPALATAMIGWISRAP